MDPATRAQILKQLQAAGYLDTPKVFQGANTGPRHGPPRKPGFPGRPFIPARDGQPTRLDPVRVSPDDSNSVGVFQGARTGKRNSAMTPDLGGPSPILGSHSAEGVALDPQQLLAFVSQQAQGKKRPPILPAGGGGQATPGDTPFKGGELEGPAEDDPFEGLPKSSEFSTANPWNGLGGPKEDILRAVQNAIAQRADSRGVDKKDLLLKYWGGNGQQKPPILPAGGPGPQADVRSPIDEPRRPSVGFNRTSPIQALGLGSEQGPQPDPGIVGALNQRRIRQGMRVDHFNDWASDPNVKSGEKLQFGPYTDQGDNTPDDINHIISNLRERNQGAKPSATIGSPRRPRRAF